MGSYSAPLTMNMVRPQDSAKCILCKRFISINNRKRFDEHMNRHHKVFYHTDLLLEACKLNSVNTEDLKVVKSIIEVMFEENIKLINGDEHAVLTDVSDATINISTSLQEMDADIPTVNSVDTHLDEKVLLEDDTEGIPSHLLNEFQKLCDVQKLVSANESPAKKIVSDTNLSRNIKLELDSGNTENRPQTFDCTKCGKSFGLSMKLKKHMQNKHSQEEVISTKKRSNDCPHCKKKKVATKKEYTCEFCDESYASFGNLHRHKKWAHKDSMKLVSNSSDKTFENKTTLKMHTVGAQTGNITLGEVKAEIQ